jgi:hypothetical protein
VMRPGEPTYPDLDSRPTTLPCLRPSPGSAIDLVTSNNAVASAAAATHVSVSQLKVHAGTAGTTGVEIRVSASSRERARAAAASLGHFVASRSMGRWVPTPMGTRWPVSNYC